MVKKLLEFNTNTLNRILDSVDFTPLYDELSKYLRVNLTDDDFVCGIEKNYKGLNCLSIHSINLKDKCTILNPVMKSIELRTYGDVYAYDKDRYDYYMQFNLMFVWETTSGIPDYHSFATVTYDNKKWSLVINNDNK